jgi:UDP-N-acetylglucosamine--N-acetylmuramyl-(pentapeptide) pyrophosphoryl-undecaprenol N-acetylglucosamine transferase
LTGRPVLLAAGGTGGHLFPAVALGEELRRRGHSVALATDSRAEKYGGAFSADAVHRIPSATLTSRAPLAVAATFTRLGIGYADALLLLLRLRPRAVIGFGGYPTLPPIIAARTLWIPTAIHEQNAVMGRANRLLSRFAHRIALSFTPTKLLGDAAKKKARLVGIPVREAVLAFRGAPYTIPEPAGPLNLLIFGGSQGARFFSEAIPPALMLLPAEMRKRLKVIQQAREEDLETAKDAYRKGGIEAELAPFFRDLPKRIAKANLVIARAGASTVAELTTIGRPAMLMPLPHALDNDQLENATRLEEAGGGWCVRQSGLTGERLAKLIEGLLSAPGRLAEAAAKSHAMAKTDAVKHLADLVEEIARPEGSSRHAHA